MVSTASNDSREIDLYSVDEEEEEVVHGVPVGFPVRMQCIREA